MGVVKHDTSTYHWRWFSPLIILFFTFALNESLLLLNPHIYTCIIVWYKNIK